MPKIMIIKYQQFAKTNTFSLSFHILFPQDTSKSGFGDGQKWGMTPQSLNCYLFKNCKLFTVYEPHNSIYH